MFNELDYVLEKYGEEVVRLARRNLNLTGFAGRRNRKANASRNLSKGLDYKITYSKTGRLLKITSKEAYASFLEEGVNGTKVKHGSPYSYKKKMVNIGAMEDYIDSKKLRLRRTRKNRAGQKISEFVPNDTDGKNKKSAAIAMAISRARKGSKAVPFAKDAMQEAFKELPKKAAEAIAKDMAAQIVLDFKHNPNAQVNLI